MKITGIVIDNNIDHGENGTTYAPIVSYNCAGREIESSSNMYSSKPNDIWSSIDIYCDPDNPSDFILDSWIDKNFWLIFLFAGFIPLGIWFWIIIHSIHRRRFIQKVKLIWDQIEADIVWVRINTSLKVNGRSPYYILAQYYDKSKNKVYEFKSDNIWYDPSSFLNQSDDMIWDINNKIKIYVLSGNYKKYWMDVDFLPKKA